MLTAQFIREHYDLVRQAMENRHAETPLDRIVELDARRCETLQELESLRAERNQRSARIGAAAADERQRLIEETRAMSARTVRDRPVLSPAPRSSRPPNRVRDRRGRLHRLSRARSVDQRGAAR